MHHFDEFAAKEVMKWYGWGSPIGLSIFLLVVGVTAIMIRYAILGR